MTLPLPDPDRSGADLPDASWGRDRLYDRALLENERIQNCETHAPLYWSFGKVLLLVRADFTVEQWTAWRKARAFDRTRCDRALLLGRAFDSADQFPADAPLLDVVALACERLGLPHRQTTLDAKFRRWLRTMNTKARERIAESAGLTGADLRPWIADLAASLIELDRACLALAAARDSARVQSCQ